MHEAGIVEDLIIAVRDALNKKNELKMIKVIHIKLGKDGHATEDSIRYWFDHIRHDHADEYPEFKEAELDIALVDGDNLSVTSVDFD